MALVSRRRCGAFIFVWCLFAWSMTYFVYRLHKDKKRDELRVANMGTLSTINTHRGLVPRRTESFKQTKFLAMNSTSIREEMAARKSLLLRQCERLRIQKKYVKSPFGKDYLHRIMVNKSKKIMFCFIPKIANTNFRRIFLYIQGVVNKDEALEISGYDVYTKYAKDFKYLNQYKEKERSKFLKEFKKIIFVREPLQRLLSAYRNKFFHPNEGIRDEYIKLYTDLYIMFPELLRDRKPIRKNLKETPVSFEEFLIYWTDTFECKNQKNEHFIPTFLLSRPCEIQYDFIGKYESLHADVRAIFSSLDIDDEFPPRNDNYSVPNTADLVEQYYKDIPNPLFKKTWKYLQVDGRLFGYKLPEWAKRKLY